VHQLSGEQDLVDDPREPFRLPWCLQPDNDDALLGQHRTTRAGPLRVVSAAEC
jgi:hypothetical protein